MHQKVGSYLSHCLDKCFVNLLIFSGAIKICESVNTVGARKE